MPKFLFAFFVFLNITSSFYPFSSLSAVSNTNPLRLSFEEEEEGESEVEEGNEEELENEEEEG